MNRRLETPHIDSARIRGYKQHYKIKLRSGSVGYRLVYEVEEKEITVYVIGTKDEKNGNRYFMLGTKGVLSN